MHKVVINGIDLSEEFIISESQYPIYSKSNIYINRAENTPHFSKMTDESKPVTLVFNKKDQCMGSIELQHYMENFVATRLKTKEPIWIEVDGRFMYAILHGVSDSDMYQGKVAATFMNIPGEWYSIEKTSTNKIVENSEKVESDKFTMSITPSSNKVTVKNSKGDKLELTLFNTASTVLIDFEKKTVTQNDRHVPLSLASRFFTLQKGRNQFVIEGATSTVIKYREVVAL